MAAAMLALVLLVAMLALFNIVAKRLELAGSVDPVAVCASAAPAPEPVMIRKTTPVAVCDDDVPLPLPAMMRSPTPVAV